MSVNYTVVDSDGRPYKTFTFLADAVEFAQEIANKLDEDMFIEKTTRKTIECVLPFR